jgi:hypothetical protein
MLGARHSASLRQRPRFLPSFVNLVGRRGLLQPIDMNRVRNAFGSDGALFARPRPWLARSCACWVAVPRRAATLSKRLERPSTESGHARGRGRGRRKATVSVSVMDFGFVGAGSLVEGAANVEAGVLAVMVPTRSMIVSSETSDLPRPFRVMNGSRAVSIRFHVEGPSGRWQTAMSIPLSSASVCSARVA